MTAIQKGLLLGAVQIAIVMSLGAKLLHDRATRPRVWVLCQVYDPELPIRGRYIAENLRIPAEGFSDYQQPTQQNGWNVNQRWAYLEVQNGKLVARPSGQGSAQWIYLRRQPDGTLTAIIQEPVLIFIPERAEIPALKRGDEMWVEVTIPKQGPPRPIRLATKSSTGQFTIVKTS